MRTAFLAVLCVLSVEMIGCASGSSNPEAERFGKTFYLDGAGNWGFGSASVPAGLKDAGYEGDVEIYIWTTSLNPLIDQLNIGGAKIRAAALANRIKKYRKEFPENDLNIIALSAGTGVATWAIENIGPDVTVNNLVLLGSSLSNDYNMSKALRNMTGNIYVYHSPHDSVLDGVTIIGTIDGKRGVAAAGAVGLRTPSGLTGRVINIPWDRRYIASGWTGAHTDCTSQPFIRQVVSRHIVSSRHATASYSPAEPDTDVSLAPDPELENCQDEILASVMSSD